ncbi:MAG: M20/M25/M40 family metallo-hydrolase [Nitratireductor sp.]
MVDLSQTLAILDDLVAIASVPGQANREWLSYVRSRLEAAGCRVAIVPSPSGDCEGLVASTGPGIPGGLVLSGHADVVSAEGQNWTSDPFRLRLDGSRAFGRGTADMKGFVACAITMMEHAASRGLERPLHLALSGDEETTCQSAVSLAGFVAQNLPVPRGVLIGEPTCLQPVNRHRASFTWEVEVKGRSAHASMPELGLSATALAAHLIAWIDNRSARIFSPDATTHSIGTIMGGTANNIIAEHCRFEWDIRLSPHEDIEELTDDFRSEAERLLAPQRDRVPEAAVHLSENAVFPGFHTDANNVFAQECIAASIAASLLPMAAATEAGIYHEAGLPVIVMGPGNMEQAHTPDEYIELDQLAACLHQLSRLALA